LIYFFPGAFSRLRPSINLSPSRTGFDLIVREPDDGGKEVEPGFAGIGWGTTLARNPRTSSPLKVADLPVPSVSPVADYSPVADDCIQERFERVSQHVHSQSSTVQRTTRMLVSEGYQEVGRKALNETFYADPEPGLSNKLLLHVQMYQIGAFHL
jgi:hypothetical protein